MSDKCRRLRVVVQVTLRARQVEGDDLRLRAILTQRTDELGANAGEDRDGVRGMARSILHDAEIGPHGQGGLPMLAGAQPEYPVGFTVAVRRSGPIVFARVELPQLVLRVA